MIKSINIKNIIIIIKSININNCIICVILILFLLYLKVRTRSRSTPSGSGHSHAHTQVEDGRVHTQPQGGLDASMPSLSYVRAPPGAGAQPSATWRLGNPRASRRSGHGKRPDWLHLSAT